MQTVGQACASCGSKILTERDGRGCSECDVAFHRACVRRSKDCPRCGSLFARMEAAEARRRAEQDERRDRFAPELGNRFTFAQLASGMLSQPRATVRSLAETMPGYGFVPLILLSGFASSLSRMSSAGVGGRIGLGLLLLGAAVVGSTSHLVLALVTVPLFRRVGAYFGGMATSRQVRTAMAWAMIPTLLTLPVWMVGYVVLGPSMFVAAPPEDTGVDAIHTIVWLATAGLGLWTVWLWVVGFATVNEFSIARSVGSLAVTGAAAGTVVVTLVFLVKSVYQGEPVAVVQTESAPGGSHATSEPNSSRGDFASRDESAAVILRQALSRDAGASRGVIEHIMRQAALRGHEPTGPSPKDLVRVRDGEKELQGVRLRGADLTGVDLSGADLTDADLRQTNLQNANLSKTRLRRTNLQDANLKGATLAGARLDQTAFNRANLSGADLSGTNFETVLVGSSRYDSRTRFPPGFDPCDQVTMERTDDADVRCPVNRP